MLIIRAVMPERGAQRDSLVMVGSVALLMLLTVDGRFSPLDSAVFLLLYGGYLAHLYRTNRSVEVEEGDLSLPAALVFVMVGSGTLLWGSFMLIHGAVGLAIDVGFSTLFIGLTVVAIGTSLPEMATSLAATLHGSRGIAVGNIIGSNIINTFLVLGVAGAIAPIDVDASFLSYQLVILLAVSLVLTLMCHRRMARWMGIMLLALYFPLFLFLS
ncbi:MAG TPA: sodium:calcium antiporter [Thermoplasmata archaeon]|nr:sodium:calcium antiporter [Thermoplasmata archaeon]